MLKISDYYIKNSGYEAIELTGEERKRLKEGMEKVRESLIREYEEERTRPSSLPKDWRNRLIRVYCL